MHSHADIIFLTVHLANAACALRARLGHLLSHTTSHKGFGASFCKSESCWNGRTLDKRGDTGQMGRKNES